MSADEIPVAECWDLLRTVTIGRLALSMGALPAILPVQFHVDGAELAVCLGHQTVAERNINEVIVALAADHISSDMTGWSIQVQGQTRIHRSDGLPLDCGQPAGGQLLRLRPATISGARIRLCPISAG